MKPVKSKQGWKFQKRILGITKMARKAQRVHLWDKGLLFYPFKSSLLSRASSPA
jgi:hypothetical protein